MEDPIRSKETDSFGLKIIIFGRAHVNVTVAYPVRVASYWPFPI